ncbi:MAG: LamG domain-containing protein [Candidatus Poribacteria bacterium]|nr:LamG domain-containing protein [Candidatus Poribacteria bacterium]
MRKIMLLLTYTVTTLILLINAFADTIVTDGLVSYWTFDRNTINNGTVQDVWGENDATIVGNPTLTKGSVKRGIRLDGIGDYVRLPNISNFGSRIGSYTFEAWFKTTQNSWSAIYQVNEPPCVRHNRGYGILINAAWDDGWDNIIVTKKDSILIQRTNKVGEGGCAGGSSTREYRVSDGEWHQVVYTTRAPTDEELALLRFGARGICSTQRTYIDNVPIAEGVGCTSGPLRSYTESIYLGAINDDGKALGFFNGVFDEVRIYDRALTHEEVTRNYDIVLSVEAGHKLSTVWGSLKMRR